jgi:hypothetical protein
VGDPQDADELHPAFLLLRDTQWSAPSREGSLAFRTLAAGRNDLRAAIGHLLFRLWFFYPQSEYSLEVTYRLRGGSADLSAGRGQALLDSRELPESETWRTERVRLTETGAAATVGQDDERDDEDDSADDLSRWPGAKGLRIDDVRILDGNGETQVIFATGESLTIDVGVTVDEPGDHPLYLAALIFRDDGLITTRHVSSRIVVSREPGERFQARLELGDLLLGNGTYLVSVGLYARLDVNDIEPSEFYDYFDKSYEFRIVGNPALHNEIVRHPGQWVVEGAEASVIAPLDATEEAREIVT